MKSKKEYKLIEIIQIFAGYSFRSALQDDADGNMQVIQARDVRSGLYVNSLDLRCIKMEYDGNRVVQKGDVILSSRGFFIAAVVGDINRKTIATSSVYILRPDIKKIIPEYLAIYLNSTKGQNKFKRYETGAAMKTIFSRDLQEIKIPIPSMEKTKNMYKFI